MKNEHLVPLMVLDMIMKLDTQLSENERGNIILRLKTTNEFINQSLEKQGKKDMFQRNKPIKKAR